MSPNPKWPDLIAADAAYVVLRKGNRLQVIVRPTGKQLRRRGRRDWLPVASGRAQDGADVADDLRDAVLTGLAALAAGADRGPKRAGRKKSKQQAEGHNGHQP